MLKALSSMMKTPVTIKPYLGTDTVGDKAYGSDINTKCLVESRVSIVRAGRLSRTGERDIYDGAIYVNGDIPVTKNDLIIFKGEEHVIQKLWAEYDGDQVSIWVVYF